MHHSYLQFHSDEQASETLVRLLEGHISIASKAFNSGLEPPRKRRKVNTRSPETPPHPDDPGHYLTLARVDINIVLQRSPRESYPSPSSDGRSDGGSDEIKKECPVELEELTPENDGRYKCRVSMAGDVLFDEVMQSNIPGQTLEILQQAIHPAANRGQRPITKSTLTVSDSLDSNRNADAIGTGHDASFHSLDLTVRIVVLSAKDLSGTMGISHNTLLDLCAPELLDATEAWSPRDFYDNVHVPKSEEVAVSGIDELHCTLYPFQRRALKWLLEREQSIDVSEKTPLELPPGFVRTVDADGKQCFVSRFLGLVTTDEKVVWNIPSKLKGGILAEEMGLGKTVEMIGLICAHKRDLSQKHTSPNRFPQSSATLIITPPAILQQWKTELQTLAPSLTLLVYEGLKVEQGKGNHDELLLRCMQHDVVLTTYNILAKEVHYTETPDRKLRHDRRYVRRLSPLTQTVWWRVVLDEAQMVESGVSNAARVAKLIPREIAWCVSGTPVKKDARDLFGLLDFLGYQPYCNFSPPTWDRLVKHHKSVFKQIFQALALRHTKDHIKNDLQLPVQKRVVITVPFTQIEEQHYSALFKEMSDDCGLDLEGAPLEENWDPDSPVVVEKMRHWLTRLRQTCLHPELGHRNRQALGNTKGPLRTVGEVLEVMIEQSDTAIRSEERVLLLSQIRRGQILEHAGFSEEALEIWSQTLQEAKVVVQECRNQLQIAIESFGVTEGQGLIDEGDGIEAATSIRTGPHRQRLRAAVEIEHMCTFFIANAYYQIKTDETTTKADSDEFQELERKEGLTYERAKALRKELLSEVRKKVDVVTNRIDDRVKLGSLVTIPETLSLKEYGGIESRRYFERINSLMVILQRQATQFQEWREKTVKLLLQPLVDEEESDLQGNEYENSTKEQDEVYAYVDVLGALVADRNEMVTGQVNLNISHAMTIALKKAKEGQGHSPELFQQLLSARAQLKPKGMGSIRALITDVRELKTGLRQSTEKGNTRAAAELLIVNSAMTKLNRTSTEQMKAGTGLDREVELLRDGMNLRLEYYKQLQAISDTVAPYEVEMTAEARNIILDAKMADEVRMKGHLATMKGTARYLVHLRGEQTDVESQKLCIICQSSFESGILTSCGHSYCVDCIRFWWSSHRTCPTCKKKLSRNDFHQITYKPQELIIEEEAQPEYKNEGMAREIQDSIYSSIRDTTLKQIKNIDMDGSFGTKIDTLARHVLWIREHDPGAKSIFFSQYRDFLEVLSRAFTHFKIGWTGIDRKSGIQKFKDDPSMECFFLHAKAHSSGLNLVNATHVFLCEPLINAAIELQAIARVHRIGQHQATTVWMYLVENTVEKSIYDISVTRRLAHMGHSNVKDTSNEGGDLESKIEAANTFELEERPFANLLTKGSSGGEIVGKEDLWHCLFRQKAGQAGRATQETERLIARHVGAAAAEAQIGLEVRSDSRNTT